MLERDRMLDLAIDLARQKGHEALADEIVQECEDLVCHDWVHEDGRDAVDFQLRVSMLCFATDEKLDLLYPPINPFNAAERLARIRQLFLDEFKFYAQKRAEREIQ